MLLCDSVPFLFFNYFDIYSSIAIHHPNLPVNETSDPKSILNEGSSWSALCAANSRNQPSEYWILHSCEGLDCYLSAVSTRGWPGLKSLMGVASIDAGQPGLILKQLARCFPSHLGESFPRVKFRGLGRAAGNRSPGSSPHIEHIVVKIAYHFGLPSTRFPPLCRLGKEGGVPASL